MDCSKWILGLMRPKMVDEVVHHGKAIGYVMAVSEEEVGMLPWNFGFVEERSMKVVADQGHTKLGLSPINHMCKVVIILEGFWLGKEKRFLTADLSQIGNNGRSFFLLVSRLLGQEQVVELIQNGPKAVLVVRPDGT